ncbi:potassium/proton antiporter [Propionibacteriaceae bacterium Y1685]|uniref:potassium/proton antiporter n=1 Tax=Microlunatus sp. Y1700 TaxID=3418487 RepID=UPI003B7A23D3
MIPFDTVLLIGAVVVILAVVAARVGSGIGLPALLLFLGLGMLLGDAVLGIEFSDAGLAQQLGILALAVILAEGGLSTKWSDIRSSVAPAALLATLGVAVSVAVVAAFGYFVLGLDPWIAVLLGAVCTPTDAAAVFAVLRNVGIPHQLRGTLEAESGLNDAPTILLVTVASSAAVGSADAHGSTPWSIVLLIIVELVGGLVLGAVAGWIGVQLMRRVALPASGLYPIATVTWVMLAYALSTQIHVSGFAAAYVCALILGNAGLPHRTATRSFVEGIGWIAQIGLFVMLGLLASPGRLTWETIGIGIAAGVVLTFVARPLSVWVSTALFRSSWQERTFLSWAGLRGAVPIVLTTIPLAAGVAGADRLFDIVLVFVIVFTLLQGPTLPLAARLLGLYDPNTPADVDVEVAALDRIKADLMQVRIPDGSGLGGVFVSELRLPRNVAVSLIVRDEVAFTPGDTDRIQAGDDLLIVAPAALRASAEKRLRAVAKHGRLARWRGEHGQDA